MHSDFIEKLKTQYPGPLTRDEKKLLQDMRFLINFVLDYDLNISLVLKVMDHDLREIVRQGSLDKAVSEGFLPKSYGFSNYR